MKNAGIYKRITAGIITLLICFSMSACNKGEQPDGSAKVEVEITNEVVDRISALTVSYSLGGDTIGSASVENAGSEKYLGSSTFSFPIYAEDVKSERELRSLVVTITVTEPEGITFDAAILSLPSRFGDHYELILTYDDGCYQVWQITDDGEFKLIY